MKDYNEFWKVVEKSHSSHPSVRFRNHFIIKTVKKSLSSFQKSMILDVGCGNGDLLIQLNECLNASGQDLLFSGCDVSEYRIQKNKSNGLPFDFWVADFNKKVELSNKFNIIICSEVIEHLKNWEIALENIANISRPGGYLILTTQSGKRYKSDIAIGHLQHFKLGDITNHLRALNYKILIGKKRGFPFYTLQKTLNSFFSSFSRNIAYAETNKFSTLLFSVTYFLFRLSLKSKKLGPQIFILAHKKG